MFDLTSLVQNNLNEYGLSESAFSVLLIKRGEKYISDILGVEALKYIRIQSYNGKIIFIEIHSSVWGQEFFFIKKEILEKLQKDFPEKKILDIRIKILGKEDIYDGVSSFE